MDITATGRMMMAKRHPYFHVMGDPILRAVTKQMFRAKIFMLENDIHFNRLCDNDRLLQRLNSTNEITYSSKRWVTDWVSRFYDTHKIIEDECSISTIYEVIEHKLFSILPNMYIVHCNMENDHKLSKLPNELKEEIYKVSAMLTVSVRNDCYSTACDLVQECYDSKDMIDSCIKWFDCKRCMDWKEINKISLEKGIIISTSTISSPKVSTASVKKLHRSIMETDDVLSLTGQLLDRLAEDQEKWKNRRIRLDNKEVMDAFVAQRIKEMEESARKRREERRLYPCKTPTYGVRRRRFRFSLIAILSKIWKMLPPFYCSWVFLLVCVALSLLIVREACR